MLIPAALLCLLQGSTPPQDLGREGPLDNATVLPTHPEAQSAVEAGDLAWRAGRRTEAYEAWRRALEVSLTGDALATLASSEAGRGLWPDADETHGRRSEGVEYGVLRRLLALGPEERVQWRERFEPSARAALAQAASDQRAIERVERDWPLTESAARAALIAADRAAERGQREDARAWLERAARHAAELPAAWRAGLARREEALARAAASARVPDEVWRTAKGLLARDSVRLVGRKPPPRSPYELPLGRLVEPGACFLDDGSLVVLAPLFLVHVLPNGQVERHPTQASMALAASVEPYVSPISAGWPLAIESDGERMYWVEGRASEEHDNSVCCMSFDAQGFPAVVWALDERGLRNAQGERERASLLGAGRFAYQPGPLLADDRLYVQLREIAAGTEGGEATSERTCVLALDAASGAPVWKRDLGRPSDLESGRGRRMAAAVYTQTPGQPLARAGTRLFVGTNAGFAALLDRVDGRLVWAFKNRRRKTEEPGWPGTRRPEVEEREGAAPTIHWAPFDSDVVYGLRAEPDLGQGVLALPPRRRGEALDLFGLVEQRALALARDGGHRALVAWDGEERHSSLYLGREERFSGAGLASASRALVASDRALYLFDRARELRLLAALPLEGAPSARGGSVLARGSRVFVLGLDTLWSFETRSETSER